MDKRGAIEGSIFIYIILLIVAILLIIIVLEFFTPYKISNFINSFIAAGSHIGGNKYA